MHCFHPSARSSYFPVKAAEDMKVETIKELLKTKSKPISNSDDLHPRREEKDGFIIKIRCPKCGNTLAYINLDEYEGPTWKRFSCRNCGSSLPVSVNPTIIQHAELDSGIDARKAAGFI